MGPLIWIKVTFIADTEGYNYWHQDNRKCHHDRLIVLVTKWTCIVYHWFEVGALFSFLCLILSSSRDTKVSQRTVLTTSGSTNSCGCSWLTGCYLYCVVFKGTICTLRIIPMPWLLPGNSCPGTEMNRCPWALFSFFISILSFIFWSLQCLSFSNGYLDAVLDNLPHSPDSLSQ